MLTDQFSFTSEGWESLQLNWTDLIQVDFVSANGRVLLDNLTIAD